MNALKTVTSHPLCGTQRILSIELWWTELNWRSQCWYQYNFYNKNYLLVVQRGNYPTPTRSSSPWCSMSQEFVQIQTTPPSWSCLNPVMLPDSVEGSGWTSSPRWMSCPVCNDSPSLENATTNQHSSYGLNQWTAQPHSCALSPTQGYR